MHALLPEEQPSLVYEEMHSNDMVVVTLKLFSVFCHWPPLSTNSKGVIVNKAAPKQPRPVNTFNNSHSSSRTSKIRSQTDVISLQQLVHGGLGHRHSAVSSGGAAGRNAETQEQF